MAFRIPDEARARRGASIERAWKALQAWGDSLPGSFSGRGARVRRLPNETHFTALRDRPRPRGFFAVAIASGAFAVVRGGRINGEMPTVTDGLGGERLFLDGRTPEGVATGQTPYLDLVDGEEGGPGEGALSYVCARILVDPATGKPAKEELGPEFLEIVHRPELPEGFFAGGMPEERVERDGAEYSSGVWPLAILTWDRGSGRVLRFDQYTVHNLQHRWTPAEEDGGRARHWFFGAT